MVHLRADPLPGQLRAAQTRLQTQRTISPTILHTCNTMMPQSTPEDKTAGKHSWWHCQCHQLWTKWWSTSSTAGDLFLTDTELKFCANNKTFQTVLQNIHRYTHNNTQILRYITTSISVLECPMLQTMQLFFIRSRCSLVTTFLFPVLKHLAHVRTRQHSEALET